MPSHAYPPDHHTRLTSQVRGGSLKGGCQYPHFPGRETEAHRDQAMGLKLHSWGETEAELKSEGLVPPHHMTSEGNMRTESCLAHLGKAVFLGFRKTALPSPHPQGSLLHPRGSPLAGRRGFGGRGGWSTSGKAAATRTRAAA